MFGICSFSCGIDLLKALVHKPINKVIQGLVRDNMTGLGLGRRNMTGLGLGRD